MTTNLVQPIPDDLATAALAAELATRLYPVVDTLKRYGLTKQQLQLLMRDAQFRHQVAEYRREWESPLSARERVKMKSALAVEDGLIGLYNLYHDATAHPQARLDAFKQLVSLADMQPKPNAQAEGTKFQLNITLAGDTGKPETVVVESLGATDGGSAKDLVSGGVDGN